MKKIASILLISISFGLNIVIATVVINTMIISIITVISIFLCCSYDYDVHVIVLTYLLV